MNFGKATANFTKENQYYDVPVPYSYPLPPSKVTTRDKPNKDKDDKK
jgi:hypothetical protein